MLRLRWATFVHPVPLAILGGGVALAVTTQLRAPWSDRAAWMAAWGVLGYIGAAFVLALQWRRPSQLNQTISNGHAAPARASTESPDLVPLIEEALRRLNNMAALGTCALVAQLPCTLRHQDGNAAKTTPLETARLLRSVIVEGIERLRPLPAAGEGASEAEVLRYAVLHEEYVLGRPNHQIMTRHNVSESTFHRYRRVGARALAAELAHREELLEQGSEPAIAP